MEKALDLQIMADGYEEIGDYTSALRLHRKAFLLQQKTFGAEHPHIAPYLFNLAMVNAALDHKEEATNLFHWLLDLGTREEFAGLVDKNEIEVALATLNDESSDDKLAVTA